jgi:hypothetical protein
MAPSAYVPATQSLLWGGMRVYDRPCTSVRVEPCPEAKTRSPRSVYSSYEDQHTNPTNETERRADRLEWILFAHDGKPWPAASGH